MVRKPVRTETCQNLTSKAVRIELVRKLVRTESAVCAGWLATWLARKHRPNFRPIFLSVNRRLLTTSFDAYRLAYRSLRTASKVRFRCYSGRYSRCYALSAKCGFSVNRPVNHPEKYAFAGNRLGNHALLTIQKMPVCVDTGMDTGNSNTRFRGDLMPQFWGIRVVSHQKSKAPSSKSGCRGARACHASSLGRWRWWVDGLVCAPCMAARLRVTWYVVST